MTEIVLQPRRNARTGRRRPAPANGPADTTRITTLDAGATPYDELWYERRPQQP